MGHPKLDLANKTAVVIGGTSGIGLEIAKGLAIAGADVVATGRRAELVRSISGEIKALGRRSLDIPSDVTDNASLEGLLDQTRAALGDVHILVNSAGRTKKHPRSKSARTNGTQFSKPTSAEPFAPARFLAVT